MRLLGVTSILALLSACAVQTRAPVEDAGRYPEPPSSSTASPEQAPQAPATATPAEPAPAWKPNTQARTTLPAVVELLTRADSLMATEQWNNAIVVAERGLRIDARNAGFYLVLAKSYHALGNWGKARQFAEQGRSLARSGTGIRDAFDRLLTDLTAASS